MELWLSGPPISVTIAEARAKRGVQAGVVIGATSTSPARIWSKSCGPSRTRAGAVTTPWLEPNPFRTCSSPLAAPLVSFSTSIPMYLEPTGRIIGGVSCCSAFQTDLRSKTAAFMGAGSCPLSRAAAVCSASCSVSQNTSSGCSSAAASTSLPPSSQAILRSSGYPSPRSESPSSRSGANFCALSIWERKIHSFRPCSLFGMAWAACSRCRVSFCTRSYGLPALPSRYIRQVSSRGAGSSAATGFEKSRS